MSPSRQDAEQLLDWPVGENGFVQLVRTWVHIAIDLAVAGAVGGAIVGTTGDQMLGVIGSASALIYCGLRNISLKLDSLGFMDTRLRGVGKMIGSSSNS